VTYVEITSVDEVRESPAGPVDELRLALVLNGGVSLAVWIGGVVSEIDALRCAPAAGGRDPTSDPTRAIYARLLEALRLTVAVDVIAGASAGGINGALLATAIQTQRRLAEVRDLWITLGQLSDLVQAPDATPAPRAFLQGEGKFLPDVTTALRRFLQEDSTSRLTDLPRDARVIITATDVAGVKIQSVSDSFRDTIHLVDHRVLFRFSCGDDSQLGWCPVGLDTAGVLARAARSTASFPFAFEPSRVGVEAFPASHRDALRTRDDTAVFGDGESATRWMIDGGALDNSPITPVLAEIQRRQTIDTPVRRTLIFVIPYTSTAAPQALPDGGPGLLTVAGTTFNLPRDLPALDDILRLKQYLRRRDVIGGADDSAHTLADAQLAELANSLFFRYRREREEEIVTTVAVRDGHATADAADEEVISPDAAANLGETLSRMVPPANGALFEVASAGIDVASAGPNDWRWGGEPLRRAGRRVLFRIRSARAALPRDAPPELRDALRTAQVEAHAALWAVPQAPAEPGEQLETGLADTADFWESATTRQEAATALKGIAGALKLARRTVAAAGGTLTTPKKRLLLDRHPFSETEDWAGRLLAADVVTKTMLGAEISAQVPDVGLRFLRLSAEAPPPFGVQLDSPSDKLYGLRLGHFGGFLAPAWRANDWMWGRLDGAARLVDVLLDETRVREAGITEAALTNVFGKAANGNPPSAVPDDASLVQWRRLARQVLHHAILEQELPRIRELFGEADTGVGDIEAAFTAYVAAHNHAPKIDAVVDAELQLAETASLGAKMVCVGTARLGGLPRWIIWKRSKAIAQLLIGRLLPHP
jgi:patatin-related protein